MGKKGIPDRWMMYSSVGVEIEGTPIIACKTPLKEALVQGIDEINQFTPSKLVETVPNIGCIIDLTATSRFYDPQVFTRQGINHVKIPCGGNGFIPNRRIVDKFFVAADRFLFNAHSRVHCTHGLNRTGYLVCRYLIERRGLTQPNAVSAFNLARGHTIERIEYTAHLNRAIRCISPAPLFQIRVPNPPLRNRRPENK